MQDPGCLDDPQIDMTQVMPQMKWPPQSAWSSRVQAYSGAFTEASPRHQCDQPHCSGPYPNCHLLLKLDSVWLRASLDGSKLKFESTHLCLQMVVFLFHNCFLYPSKDTCLAAIIHLATSGSSPALMISIACNQCFFYPSSFALSSLTSQCKCRSRQARYCWSPTLSSPNSTSLAWTCRRNCSINASWGPWLCVKRALLAAWPCKCKPFSKARDHMLPGLIQLSDDEQQNGSAFVQYGSQVSDPASALLGIQA